MSLKEYNGKRNFSTTTEPKGGSCATSSKLRFVVQRHHASHLHYDFRLEMDGVLKSWAVPKGPSLNPNDKRLAVMVEDHPLSYRSFEGEIPKGNYGFGKVTIFDEGFYTPLKEAGNTKGLQKALRDGNIKIVLHGKKLKGEFALIRIQNTSEDHAWLLIKHQDKHAVNERYYAEDLVSAVTKEAGKSYRKQSSKKNIKFIPKKAVDEDILDPMLATLSDGVSEDGEWLFEQKLDGFRAVVHRATQEVFVRSRNGVDLNSKFKTLVEALKAVDRDIILDGEIVAVDDKGDTNFHVLQHGEPFPPKYKLQYHLFDMLMLDGNDLRGYTLSERKDLLKRWFKINRNRALILVKSVPGDLNDALKKAKQNRWEGIIAKQIDSRYHSGKRSDRWRKLKLQQSQEAIIVGFTAPSGARIGFGALVLAVMHEGKLQYIGNVGTGFSDHILKDLATAFSKIIVQKKPFEKMVKVANETNVTWVKPKLIAEIDFAEWTTDNHLRHPVFKSIRNDKRPSEIQRIMPLKEISNERIVKFGRKTLKLTNQKKWYWPDDKISKGELIAYYENVGALMLPYLKDKPISMNRFPNGIYESSFFQKDLDKHSGPSWLKTVALDSESTGNTINYLLCNDLATLLWIANMGSIEINPWLATYKKKTKPTFAVLDLDPNGAEFEEVVSVANTAHDILEQANIVSYVKTSGSTGLHIYIYMGEQYTFDVVRDFIEMVAELVHKQHPNTTSLERSPNKRKKKIYLDFLQNRRAQTVVAPYSVRPKLNATVSTPLDWSELNAELTIGQFTMEVVLRRVTSKPDPWAHIFNEKADLKKAIGLFNLS